MITRRKVLAFDIGGTKTKWGILRGNGVLRDSGTFPTPKTAPEILFEIISRARKYHVDAIGIGVPGVVTEDGQEVIACPNLPGLDGVKLAADVLEHTGIRTTIANDAFCALVGENWLGAAKRRENAVLITIGTGVGGAVKQHGVLLPYPTDTRDELAELVVDSTDLLPSPHGAGSLEAMIGGRSLEKRFGVELHEMVERARRRDKESQEFWEKVADYFIRSLLVIYDTYKPDVIIVGGIGSKNLPLYLQDQPPCPVIQAKLGEKAGLYGAARLALSLL